MAPVATTESHVTDFLDMLTSERGASQNTIDAYTSDLEGYFGFLSERTVEALDAGAKDIQAYLAMLTNAGQAPASRSRRLSAVKQYYRFLLAEGFIEADPTSGLQGPKKTARAAEGAEHRRGRPLAANLASSAAKAWRAARISGLCAFIACSKFFTRRVCASPNSSDCRVPCCAATSAFFQ